jgi:hypothetical protein
VFTFQGIQFCLEAGQRLLVVGDGSGIFRSRGSTKLLCQLFDLSLQLLSLLTMDVCLALLAFGSDGDAGGSERGRCSRGHRRWC